MAKPVPPRDEFDEIYDRAHYAPLGIFVVWVAIVRGFRGLKAAVRRLRQPRRPQIWAIGRRILDEAPPR